MPKGNTDREEHGYIRIISVSPYLCKLNFLSVVQGFESLDNTKGLDVCVKQLSQEKISVSAHIGCSVYLAQRMRPSWWKHKQSSAPLTR